MGGGPLVYPASHLTMRWVGATSLTGGGVGLPSRVAGAPGVRLAIAVVATAALSAPVAFYGMFSGLREYDDEGYFLLALRHYAEGGILYDQIWAQYGPAYFQLLDAVFGLLGLPFTHATGRAAVVGIWIATAVLCAVIAYRLTGNVAVAVATQLMVVDVLVPLRNESLHPGGILALLVSAIVLLGTFLGGGRSRWAAVVVGVLLGAGTLMKANVGGFALVSTGFAVLAAAGFDPDRRMLKLSAATAFVLVPPTLMARQATVPWVRDYLVVMLCTALAVVLVQFTRRATKRGALRDLGLLAAGFVLTGGTVLAVELARGTTPAGLLRGLVLDPLRLPFVAPLPLPVASAAPGWALVSLLVALLVVLMRRSGSPRRRAVVVCHGMAQIGAGAYVWLVVGQHLPLGPLAEALPVVWLALTGPASDTDPDREVGRSVLVAVAVLQALHAYPVAGSQVAWATFLLIPVGALLIVDGWRTMGAAVRAESGTAPRWVRAIAGSLAAGMVALAGTTAFATGQRLKSVYDAGVPLNLPGAEHIRVGPRHAALYRTLTVNLATHCRTFVAIPGFSSLYLFSRLEPPSMMNITLWMPLLTPSEQLAIVARLTAMTGSVCAIRNRMPGWEAYDTPLVRYVSEEFVTIFNIDHYAFMVRRKPAS